MQISDILTKARKLVDADSTSWTDANLLIDINIAYENIVTEILKSDRTWEFDDQNFTTSPILTTTLVADQNDYEFSTEFLNILAVDILDANGDYQRLTPIDVSQVDIPLDELYPDSALPFRYDVRYGSIWLYPPPAAADVTLAAGLRIYAQRNADKFTSAQVTTGTKVPGFAVHHEALAFMAAKDYANSYRKDRVAYLSNEASIKLEQILEFYAGREKGVRRRIRHENSNFL